jgi:hypothetical protein
LVYILAVDFKEIQVYSLVELAFSFSLTLRYRINAKSLNGRYFFPKTLYLDGDGMIWIKNYDQILVLDSRSLPTGNVTVINVIDASKLYAKSINYTFTVVEKQPAAWLFMPTGSLPSPFDKKFLLVDDMNDDIKITTINHFYEVDPDELQPLPMYTYHLPMVASQRYIQSLGNSQVLITLISSDNSSKIQAVYNLNYLSMVETLYSAIHTKSTSTPSSFHLNNGNPILLFIDPTINSSSTLAY